MELKEGKTYFSRDGKIYGPLVRDLTEIDTLYEYSLGDGNYSTCWDAQGRVYATLEQPQDLIEEYISVEIEAHYTFNEEQLKAPLMNTAVNYNDGKIHGWNGGDCPVHPETVVEYWLRVGYVDEGKAEYFGWDHNDAGNDIIAFRVVKEYVEPNVVWVNEYEDGHHTAHDTEEKAKHSAKGLPSRIIRIAVKYVECKE